MIRVALDACGGDHAPERPVAGALLAHQTLQGSCEIVLVGQEDVVREEIQRQNGEDAGLRVVHAPEIIGMDEKPLAAVKSKRESSIAIGLKLHKAGQADAFISAGNTGAMMASSLLILGRTPGIERPPIGTAFPALGGPILLLDGGANVDCSAKDLVGFARLGAVYARDAFDRADPKVGLLNLGHEPEKGDALAKSAYSLLDADPEVRFVGNVEGSDILKGMCDVVVCDGFVGNVLLKFYESVGKTLNGLMAEHLGDTVARSEGAARVYDFLDYSTYGGAPLLGVQGLPIICHGRSSPRAFCSAIKVAMHAVERGLGRHIHEAFATDGAVA